MELECTVLIYVLGIKDMNEDGAQCRELTQKTADALDSHVLGQLFAVVQQNNVNVSIKAVLRM